MFLVAGLVMIGIGRTGKASLPPAVEMPRNEGFLEGRVSMKEVERSSREWMAATRRRSEAGFAATGWIAWGGARTVIGAPSGK